MIECIPTIEIDAGSDLRAVTFTANGEYLVHSGSSEVGVWRVKDGKQVATMEAKNVQCLATSNDGRKIAAGALTGALFIWDAETYESAFTHQENHPIYGVDFSPDSTRLVVAAGNGIASVWDVALGKQVCAHSHGGCVFAAKHSPQGNHIVTVSDDSVQVWDSNDGQSLANIKVNVTPTSYNTVLHWFKRSLFVLADNKILQFDPSTASKVWEWTVPASNGILSCIDLPKYGHSIAYSAERTVTFWDVPTHQPVGFIQHAFNIRLTAFSVDGCLLALCGEDGKIYIKHPSRITDSLPLSHPHPTFQEPAILVADGILDSWKQDRLEDAETLLTAAMLESASPSDHLASRALVRARLFKWDGALADATMAIEIQPSAVAYIAKSVAHVGKGERRKAYHTCDIAFERFHASHVSFLLLFKAIVVFMIGEHLDAISRVEDLIATVNHNSICYVVQAYMYLLLGNSYIEGRDYEGAIQSFERARDRMRHHASGALSVITLISGWNFDRLHILIRQQLCEALYAAGRIIHAVEYFHQLSNESEEKTSLLPDWDSDFRRRSSKELEQLGDTAMDDHQYDAAISHYTTALSLSHTPQDILTKRNKAFLATRSWAQVLNDASRIIALDPSLPWAYEMRYTALRETGDFKGAVDTFEVMLSKITQSSDPVVQKYGDKYVSLSTIQATIRKLVQRTIRYVPRVLINTTTGRLHDKVAQASAFEASSIFDELVSSMTTRINYRQVKREVRRYFQYVMLSHTWEPNEPLYAVHLVVYNLDESPTHDKLQTFCKLVRDAGFNWAWSDTCCIDKSDHFVLQEALIAMFRWYRNSALVIVFLRGVRSSSQPGALVRSIWNTRAWTLQEYVAARVIQFYTEDWTPYLALEIRNHKDSPEIIAEMEEATMIPAGQLRALYPGLSDIREKLRVASTRKATIVEDTAYSLLGIFSVAGMPVIYGEGDTSLGRLLAHVLAGSGDVSILAWTGVSGSFNSCLPAYITAFNEPATTHLPRTIPDEEMEGIINAWRSPSFDLDAALMLHDHISELPVPSVTERGMKLPCIVFPLPPLLRDRTVSGGCYYADTETFGRIEIQTTQSFFRRISRLKSFYLVHPWLDALLDREDVPSALVEHEALDTDDEATPREEVDDSVSSVGSILLSPVPSVRVLSLDKETRALRLIARLRQPFGALLFQRTSTMEYRRVVADSVVRVQIQESASLAEILDNVRILDVV